VEARGAVSLHAKRLLLVLLAVAVREGSTPISEGRSVAMSTLESQPEWIKSSLSFANGNCVEVADLSGDEIGVRNSRDAEGSVLRFTPDEWHAFIGGVHNGEFDRFGG
jgi:hypothetical protein